MKNEPHGCAQAMEVYEFLEAKGKLSEYPLFAQVHKICDSGLEPSTIVDCFKSTTPRPIIGKL